GDALEFKWRRTLAAFGGGDARSRRAAIDTFIEFVGKAAAAGSLDPVDLGLLVGRLADLLGLPADTIYGMLSSARIAGRRAIAVDRAAPRSALATPETKDATDDDSSPGLVAAVEVLLGLIVMDSRCTAWIDDAFSTALCSRDSWQRL